MTLASEDESAKGGAGLTGTNPADGTPLPPVPTIALQSIQSVVARARKASARLQGHSTEERANKLLALRDAILRRGEELVECLRLECGKPEAECWLHEVLPTADLAEYWSTASPAALAHEEVELDALQYPGKRARVERLPRGVVALITPWNFPLALPLRTIFPAVACGNAVVLKPSEHAPRVGALVAEAACEALGEDAVVVVQGAADAARALIGAGVDAVAFTGSTQAGRAVAAAAADALVPVSLELGGKDAAVVLEDAPIERTARGLVWASMANAGQNCAAVERIIAVGSVAQPLRERLVQLLAELQPGRDYGPMITEAQLQKIRQHVQSLEQSGAQLLAGGSALERTGRWFEPTLLQPADQRDALGAEEAFGPVATFVQVANEEDAVAAANDSPYGLTASVWCRDLARGEQLSRRLNAGVVMVNNHGFSGAIPSLPWSGRGESGYGVTNSKHALDVLVRPRTVIIDTRRAKRELWWHPYTPGLVTMARALGTLRSRNSLVSKLKALKDLVVGALRRWRIDSSADDSSSGST